RQCSRGRRSERDDRAWTHSRDFAVEPHTARQHFFTVGAFVNSSLAARRPLEVFEGVGEIHARDVEPGLLDRAAKKPPRLTDERQAGTILFIAGLLSNEHELRGSRTGTKNSLRRVLPQRTVVAAERLLRQRLKVARTGRPPRSADDDLLRHGSHSIGA